LAAGPTDPPLRADLHRLLGTVLYAAGDLERAETILVQGSEIAAAAGLPAIQARIRALQAEIRATEDGNSTEAIEACDEAAAPLESAGDQEGRAEVLVSAGKARFWIADPLASQVLEHAAACAQRSGNHRAEQEARRWLAATFQDLPITADAAVGRAEQLLEAAADDPWDEAAILQPLIVLYGYAGRLADARAAYQRAQSIWAASGAKLDWVFGPLLAGQAEVIAGNHVAAERTLREGYEALCSMGERGHRATLVTWLGEAVYAQGRFDQALRLTEEAEAFAVADDFDAQARWRATRAKLLARAGQFSAAARLAEEAVALFPATSDAPERAEFLVAQAEVARLAGEVDRAEAGLRRALQFYQDRRMMALAERTRALLASLAGQSRTRLSSDLRSRSGCPGPGTRPPTGPLPPALRPAPRGRSPAPGAPPVDRAERADPATVATWLRTCRRPAQHPEEWSASPGAKPAGARASAGDRWCMPAQPERQPERGSSANEPHRHRQVAESFGADPGRYDRARPCYPGALVERIVAASPGPGVLDVGCGPASPPGNSRRPAAGCSGSTPTPGWLT
jgi:tetratricopeptide (TPR) repeat protein